MVYATTGLRPLYFFASISFSSVLGSFSKLDKSKFLISYVKKAKKPTTEYNSICKTPNKDFFHTQDTDGSCYHFIIIRIDDNGCFLPACTHYHWPICVVFWASYKNNEKQTTIKNPSILFNNWKTKCERIEIVINKVTTKA